MTTFRAVQGSQAKLSESDCSRMAVGVSSETGQRAFSGLMLVLCKVAVSSEDIGCVRRIYDGGTVGKDYSKR